MAKSEEVFNPSHYQGEIEAITIIEAITKQLPGDKAFLLGNVLKYALRAGKKGNADDDLEKAANYAHRLIYAKWVDTGKERHENR